MHFLSSVASPPDLVWSTISSGNRIRREDWSHTAYVMGLGCSRLICQKKISFGFGHFLLVCGYPILSHDSLSSSEVKSDQKIWGLQLHVELHSVRCHSKHTWLSFHSVVPLFPTILAIRPVHICLIIEFPGPG